MPAIAIIPKFPEIIKTQTAPSRIFAIICNYVYGYYRLLLQTGNSCLLPQALITCITMQNENNILRLQCAHADLHPMPQSTVYNVTDYFYYNFVDNTRLSKS